MNFIQIAEETGLIVRIGEWVLREAVKEALRWPDDTVVAVNLSPAQFKNQKLLSTVVAALGPGVRKINVQGRGRHRRQQEFHRVGRLQTQQPQVVQFRPQPFAVRFPDAPQQPLDAQDIALGMRLGVTDQKRAVAAAHLDFERLLPREQLA